MATETLVPPGPTPSCRVDYLTCSYKLPSASRCEDLLDLAWSLGHHVMPNGDMSPARQGRLYEETRMHDSGVAVDLTLPSSGRRNAGSGTLSVPGSVFAALDSAHRNALYIEMKSFEGFYRCTRIDTQFTVLNPEVDIFTFVDEVEQGNIWCKGYSGGQPYKRVGRDGKHRIPPTYYFGAPESPSRVRVYDHGAKWEWPMPSMRFEVQQRKQNANDTFRALVNSVRSEVDSEPLFLAAEANLVKSISREKLDLRDTAGIDREALGGKWLRKAPRLKWYAELVDAPDVPVERRARPVPTLNQTMDAMVEQYGGAAGAWVLRTMAEEGCTLKQASEALARRFIGRMGDQHRARGKSGLSEKDAVVYDKHFAKLQPESARMAEHCWCD